MKIRWKTVTFRTSNTDVGEGRLTERWAFAPDCILDFEGKLIPEDKLDVFWDRQELSFQCQGLSLFEVFSCII